MTDVRFANATVSRVLVIIREPPYAGIHEDGFEHRHGAQRSRLGAPADRTIDEFVELWSDHERYIAHEEYFDDHQVTEVNAASMVAVGVPPTAEGK